MSLLIFLPENISARAEINKTILDIALENDIPVEHNCGGTCSCTSCMILLKNNFEFFNDISKEEKEQIDISGLNGEGLRLACMAKLLYIPKTNTEIEIIRTEDVRED